MVWNAGVICYVYTSTVWHGLAWNGVFNMAWNGVLNMPWKIAWIDRERYGMPVLCHGLVWNDVFNMAWIGMEWLWHGLAWNGILLWHGLAWNGIFVMAWIGMVCTSTAEGAQFVCGQEWHSVGSSTRSC